MDGDLVENFPRGWCGWIFIMTSMKILIIWRGGGAGFTPGRTQHPWFNISGLRAGENLLVVMVVNHKLLWRAVINLMYIKKHPTTDCSNSPSIFEPNLIFSPDPNKDNSYDCAYATVVGRSVYIIYYIFYITYWRSVFLVDVECDLTSRVAPVCQCGASDCIVVWEIYIFDILWTSFIKLHMLVSSSH